ncbi:BgTH12-02526 [Blumeria graminis f. sp. triticale]|uniref:BgTH12-02526 n=1 Tax=Blumeria graminis f. sp. triticale TaxID=1689686 RepID=A0A9W4D172_BLUGR|nr:BgTH12-02526 [Blumeria graminis f. sp. triticale]
MKSSALVFFAALLSHSMPILALTHYNCRENYIPVQSVKRRVKERYNNLIERGFVPSQHEEGTEFGRTVYSYPSMSGQNDRLEVTISFDKNQRVLSVDGVESGSRFNCPGVHIDIDLDS